MTQNLKKNLILQRLQKGEGDLSGLSMKRIPKEVFQPDIEELLLNSNAIEEIPQDISAMKSLKRLHLSLNALKAGLP